MMRQALAEARAAFALGEVPVGAVVARNGQMLSAAHNRTQMDADPTAHAEILALRMAGKVLGDFRLAGCTLYVTLEPCAMCAGAIATARLSALWYGASDAQRGCAGSVYHLCGDKQLDFSVPTFPGLLAEESAALLQDFFARKRQPGNSLTLR